MSVFFIIGASRGLGRELTTAALKAGHQVIATARNPKNMIADGALLPLPLDITDEQQPEDAVRAGIERFGRIDVVVNNAGYGLYGSVEETPDADVRALFDTNVFGMLNVVRAVLPSLRAQRAGHVINISSSAGFGVGAGRGLYGATKFALEALSEALHGELSPLGVRVTIVEPGSFRTDFLTSESVRLHPVGIDDYADTVGALFAGIERNNGRQPGDPVKAAAAILQIAESADPPLRLQLGSDAVALVEAKLQAVAEELDRNRALTLSTDFPRP